MMKIMNALAGIAVRDFDTATGWYSQLLGRAPDTLPMEGLAEWRFEDGGWLQVLADPARAGSSVVTFVERDLDDRLSRLGAIDPPLEDLALGLR